jgi:ATP adenylyltransferase
MNCAYCTNIFSPKHTQSLAAWDEIIHETPHFVLTPTVGSMVEGWVLIISKRHVPAMGALNTDELEELKELTNKVRHIIKETYGSVVVFEHGPYCDGTNFGCGIDHAHFHVVPIPFSLRDHILEETNYLMKYDKITDINDLRTMHLNSKSYIYLSDNEYNNDILFHSFEIPSQFIRRIIAKLIGIPDLYDYKQNIFADNAIRTSTKLKEIFNKNLCVV